MNQERYDLAAGQNRLPKAKTCFRSLLTQLGKKCSKKSQF